MLNLAGAFGARGHRVDLVLCSEKGSYRDHVPAGVNVIVLRSASGLWSRVRILMADPRGFRSLLRPVLLPLRISKKFRYVSDLARYLQQEQPDVVLSAMTNVNLTALWARRLVRTSTRIAISERNTVSQRLRSSARTKQWRQRYLCPAVARTYPSADEIIAVSAGVAEDLALTAGICRERIKTIHNPVVTPELLAASQDSPDHPWFGTGAPPVVLAVGRLHEQKDFPTLLKAFARVRARMDARLVILGDAKQAERRSELVVLARELGIEENVDLPGFVQNPFSYMRRASVFVLSSAWEGLPGVLVQALACGCPVVSTDCPSGPAEILEHGTYGRLVPVGNSEAMAEAIQSVLSSPPDREQLRARAAAFSVDRAAERYLEVLLGTT